MSPLRFISANFLMLLILSLVTFCGCSLVGVFGKREPKLQEAPPYFGAPMSEKLPEKLSEKKPEAEKSSAIAPPPQKADELPWLMSDRAKEISRDIDAKW